MYFDRVLKRAVTVIALFSLVCGIAWMYDAPVQGWHIFTGILLIVLLFALHIIYTLLTQRKTIERSRTSKAVEACKIYWAKHNEGEKLKEVKQDKKFVKDMEGNQKEFVAITFQKVDEPEDKVLMTYSISDDDIFAVDSSPGPEKRIDPFYRFMPFKSEAGYYPYKHYERPEPRKVQLVEAPKEEKKEEETQKKPRRRWMPWRK